MRAAEMKMITNKEILDEAQEYEIQLEFRENSQFHYKEAYRRKLLEIACRHMGHGYIHRATELLRKEVNQPLLKSAT